MTDFFENLAKLDLQDVIDQQLKLQVDAPWPAEVECLETHGLKDATRVLDIGTGNGYFLLRLAKRYPEKEFIGVEVSESLASLARASVEKGGLTNVEIINEKCPTDKIIAEFDFAFARLALYVTTDKKELLSWIHSMIVKGGRAAIIEEDISLAHAEPPNPSWDKYVRTLKQLVTRIGAELTTRSGLCEMLLGVGVREILVDEKHWYSSSDMQPEDFRNYWAADSMTIHKIAPDLFTAEDCKKFNEFIAGIIDSDTVALFSPIVVASGEK